MFIVPPYAVDNSNPSTFGFGLVERRKARGTGTYIPHPKRNSSRERPSQARRNQLQSNRCHVQKNISNNIVDTTSPKTLDANSIRINTFEGGDKKEELTDSYIEELTKKIRPNLVDDMEAKLQRKVIEIHITEPFELVSWFFLFFILVHFNVVISYVLSLVLADLMGLCSWVCGWRMSWLFCDGIM